MRDHDIALYGLGVMGSSLAKNMIRRGFRVAAYSKSGAERERFAVPGFEDSYVVCADEREMLDSLKAPRIVFLMITAGPAVDSVIGALAPLLRPGDVLIDGGNSYYRDTARRCRTLEEMGVRYLGVGVSGGEKGALNGPSMMAGGSREGWEACRHILTAIAARCGQEPCCAYMAQEGAGHYVKMVHNGIEYAQLQLIAETYHLMKHGLGLPHGEITELFRGWKKTKLNSYLIDISVSVLEKMDEDGTPLVEKILDAGEQKGTGRWTLAEAVELGVYVPTIFEAVFARTVSSDPSVRQEGSRRLPAAVRPMELKDCGEKLADALLLGIISTYAQGMALIERAAREYGWQIDMEELTAVWRAGCIIRSELLTEVKAAVAEGKKDLLLTDAFAYAGSLEGALREVVCGAEAAGTAVPGLASALHYYDYLRMEKTPMNFVQALRDCFGAHTYQRIDREGRFHTQWE